MKENNELDNDMPILNIALVKALTQKTVSGVAGMVLGMCIMSLAKRKKEN